MASSSGGAILFIILLGVGVGIANDEGDATSTGTTTQGFGTTSSGDQDVCAGTTSYDTDAGTYVLPTDSNDALFGARDCMLSTTAGSGAPVQVLQSALATCYQQPVAADGVYGPATAAAVQAVQGLHGLPADGTFGESTSEAMLWPTTTSSGQVICASNG
jgi:peptidoglycan hydrolase-like protein with peptidoglycan-binding domain